MDFLNQPVDVGGHDQQVASRGRAGIPVRVRRSAWHEYGRASVGLNFLLANPNTQSAFEHVPRFVIVAVKMKWSNPARRSGRTARIFPLGDHEIPAD